MKLNRSIEAWDKCDAGAMSQMSEAAIKYAFADAKQDIKRMAAIQAQLVAALKAAKTWHNGEKWRDSSDPSEVQAWGQHRDIIAAALAAAGAHP